MAMKLLKERTPFAFKVGQVVYDMWRDEMATVLMKRWENGHRCYRLDNGRIVHENKLRA